MMFKYSRGPGPPNNSQVSPHPSPHEVARVLNTITEISASAEIIRRYERGNSCLSTATLERVSDLSDSLWEEVMSLPLPTIPTLHKPLIIYELILVDILRILSSSGPVEISDDTIDRRLDDFLLQFQEALDLLKGPIDTGKHTSSNSTHFFQNSHHINIYGGYFSASTCNPVVHDPVVQEVREQNQKFLQVIHIQWVVLFS